VTTQKRPTYATHSSDAPQSQMSVRKRNGTLEPIDLNKILRAVSRFAEGISDVDASRVAIKTIGGLYDGATTKELDLLSIRTASELIPEDPNYSKLATRLLAEFVRKEVVNQEIHSFSQAIAHGYELGIINDRLSDFVKANARKLNNVIDNDNNDRFEYFGIRTVYDRYLLKHPQSRLVIETPQYFFMRVAAALSNTVVEAIELYRLISQMYYMPSTPTLFNAGTRHEQMSSCYLMAPPEDSLDGIYSLYKDIAFNSKFAGGIGTPWSTIRSEGALIQGTNGRSNGVIPWLATLNMSVAAVDQGGRRKGAAAVYLPCWHADIEAFLELRDNTGDHARRAHNLNLAQWIPDLFMQRVEEDGDWALFDPREAPLLQASYGEAFNAHYEDYVLRGLAKKVVKARDLYGRMMRTLAETGNGWMCWSDAVNRKCNQTMLDGNYVASSNLCTEITEVTRTGQDGETAVCNLASMVLPAYFRASKTAKHFDFPLFHKHVKRVVRQLDVVIDRNFYPIESARRSNQKWRPVGLGMMGLQDLFFLMGFPFDSPDALDLSTRISEEMYYSALSASVDLAEELGPCPGFHETWASSGKLSYDLWGVQPADPARWDALRERVVRVGMRNSLLIAIAPTATIGSITGVYECVEPAVTNLLKRETLSGEFIQINRYLVNDLKRLGLWNETVRNQIKLAEGSVQGIDALPLPLRTLHRTAWELSNKTLIDLAAARGPFIDQSASLNLFMESPNIGKLSSMYIYAWKKGLKTTYYLRSRPATRITQTTIAAGGSPAMTQPAIPAYTPEQAVQCSLDNPESCEACQ
jgi:ribonucleoside-diphosphate reductase alpha chain